MAWGCAPDDKKQCDNATPAENIANSKYKLKHGARNLFQEGAESWEPGTPAEEVVEFDEEEVQVRAEDE